MKELLQEILGMDNVYGAMLVANDGKILFSQFSTDPGDKLQGLDWAAMVESLDGAREVILVLDHRRFYIRKIQTGYVLVLMGHVAAISMIRLNCDSIIPSLEKASAPKGLGRFFRRK